tara:strand:- start:4746 stop:5639 length:894 start_codon:yes stop_codon:yes gene_type:complete
MAFSSAGANAFFDKRDAAREKRRDKEELRREKELDRAFQRENSLFALSLENLKDSNKYLKGDKYTSAVKANQTLRQGLMDSDLTAEDLQFYEPILEDPFAAQFVQNFIEERAGQGLNITYSMIPSMLNVVSSNAPETEKIDFIERITGTDFTGEAGIKRYRELATEIVSAPSEIQSTLFVSPKPGMSINTKNRDAYNKEMVKKVEAQVMPLARRMQRTLFSERGASDNEVQRLTRLIEQVESAGSGSEAALRLLLETVEYNKESFDELVRLYPMDFIDWEANPFLSGMPELFPDLEE